MRGVPASSNGRELGGWETGCCSKSAETSRYMTKRQQKCAGSSHIMLLSMPGLHARGVFSREGTLLTQQSLAGPCRVPPSGSLRARAPLLQVSARCGSTSGQAMHLPGLGGQLLAC